MSDTSPTGLGAAVARLVTDAGAVDPEGRVTPPRTDAEGERAGLAMLADVTRAVGARLALALGTEVPDDRRNALSSLLGRAESLDRRVRAAAREATLERRDGFERGLRELRSCTSMAELMERFAPIMCEACAAERVSVGIVVDGAWTPIREADRTAGAPLRHRTSPRRPSPTCPPSARPSSRRPRRRWRRPRPPPTSRRAPRA